MKTEKPQFSDVKERMDTMEKNLRASTLGEALDSGFYLRKKANGDLWLCLGQWQLQKIEVQD